jgi:O-antigen ligase
MSIYGMHFSEIWSFVPERHSALWVAANAGELLSERAVTSGQSRRRRTAPLTPL